MLKFKTRVQSFFKIDLNMLNTLSIVKILSVLFLTYFAIWPFFLGDANFLRIHDMLDSRGYLDIMSSSNEFYILDPSYNVESLMGGIPRGFLGSPFSLANNFIFWFGQLWGNLLNNFFVRITGFLGMYLLLSRHLMKGETNLVPVWITSTLFACLPFFQAYGLGSFGIPLLVFIIFQVKESSIKPLHFFITLYLCSYMNFYHVGFFVILGFWIWYVFISICENKIKANLFIFGLLLISGFLIKEYMSFLSFFSDDALVSHRIEKSCDITMLNFKGLIGVSFLKLALGNYHSALYYGYFILFLFPFAFFATKSIKGRRKIILLLGISCLIAFTSVLLEWNKMSWLYNNFKIFCQFNFRRIDFLMVFFMYLLFGFLIKAIFDSKANRPIRISVTFFIFLISFGLSIYSNNQFLKREIDEKIIYKAFKSENLFNAIDEDINFKNLNFKVACIGISPSLVNQNQGKTIDGYYNRYPLNYKHTFLNLIGVKNNENANFNLPSDGSRCYIPFELNELNEVVNLKLNSQILGELNCKYIFSNYAINKLDSSNFKLVNVYLDKSSYLNQVYVYKVI